MLPQFLFAQFTGGNSDGASNAIVSQSSCIAYTTDFMFYGGSSDGYSAATLTQGACLSSTTDFVFYGGNSDGFSAATLSQGACVSPTTDFVFYGGNSDGFNAATLSQGVCLPPTTDFVFYGGNSDGFNAATLSQAVCPPPTTDFIFYGGNSDGFNAVALIQGVCLPPTTDFIFHGGAKDGFGLGIIEQSICPNTTPLPIELLEFKARLGKEGVEISWITATEVNNDFFNVEKSNTGFDFYSLAKVAGAGNSVQQLKYSVTDISPFQGVNYYRLKQTDYDGKFTYSKIVSVNVESISAEVSVYPNPNDGRAFYVKLPNTGNRNITIKIQGMDGKVILSETVNKSGTFEFTPSVKLAAGVYIISIFDDLNFSTVKLVVR